MEVVSVVVFDSEAWAGPCVFMGMQVNTQFFVKLFKSYDTNINSGLHCIKSSPNVDTIM
jgi:hypothetical protein